MTRYEIQLCDATLQLGIADVVVCPDFECQFVLSRPSPTSDWDLLAVHCDGANGAWIEVMQGGIARKGAEYLEHPLALVIWQCASAHFDAKREEMHAAQRAA